MSGPRGAGESAESERVAERVPGSGLSPKVSEPFASSNESPFPTPPQGESSVYFTGGRTGAEGETPAFPTRRPRGVMRVARGPMA